LQAKIEEAEKLSEVDYIEATWTNLQNILIEAKIINENDDVTQQEVDAALEKLLQVIKDFQEKPEAIDKTDLQVAIEEAEKPEEADYTEETWTNLQNALSEAKLINEKADVTQQEVDDALENLLQAIGDLQEKPEPSDKTGLQVAIEEAEQQKESDYLESTWTNLQGVLGEAKIINENDGATQEEVDNIVEELLQAIEDLQKKTVPTDKTKLQEKIAKADELEETDYLESTWMNLQSVLKKAKSIDAKEDASQKEVDDILEDLSQAIKDLQGKTVLTDKKELQAKIEETKKLVEAEYIEETWVELQSALEEAILVESKADVSQKEVNDALEELLQAIKGLQEKPEPIDKAELQAKIEEAEKLAEEDYTEETWEDLQNALEEAILVEAKADASQKEVNDALEELLQAIKGLQEKPEPIDKAELQAKIEEAEKLTEAEYTEETWEDLQSMLGAAKAINAKDDATQEEVDSVLLKLTNAIQGLEVRTATTSEEVDKTKLRTKIQEVEQLVEAEYTTITWRTLEGVLVKAKTIEAKEDATQKEVDDVVVELEQSVHSLIGSNANSSGDGNDIGSSNNTDDSNDTSGDNTNDANSTDDNNNANAGNNSGGGNDSNGGNNSNRGNNSNNANNSGNSRESETVRTGDAQNTIMMLLIMIASGAVVMILLLKRRKAKEQEGKG